jgi:hypothetical protein
VHDPVVCGGCGSQLSGALAVGVARRQVFEVPEPKVTVTEHRIVTRRTVPRCTGVASGGGLGPRSGVARHADSRR